MPSKPKAPRKSTPARAQAAARDTERAIRRIEKSIEGAQSDFAKLGGSLGGSVGDLRRNVTRMLRDARRDLTKIGNATRKDLERLQKEMVAATKPRSASKARASAKAASTKRAAAKRPAAKRPAAKKPARKPAKKAAKPRTAAKR